MDGLSVKQEHSGESNKAAFYLLIFFTLILYLAPQHTFTFLQPLHLAKTSIILASIALLMGGEKARQLSLNSNEKTLIMFSCIAIISIPFSSWPGGSFSFFLEIYFKVIVIFFLMSRLISSTEYLDTIITVLIWCSFYFAIVALWNYTHQIYSKGSRIGGPEGGMARDPNDLALCLVMMVPFAAARYNLTKPLIKKVMYLCVLFVFIGGIYASFSRGGFLGLATILGITLLRLPSHKKIIVFFIVCLVSFLALPLLSEEYFSRMVTIVDTEKDPTGSAGVRFDDMKISFLAAIKSPILGTGLGMNTLAIQNAGKSDYWGGVHSAPLQVASELGLVALYVYFYLFFRTYINLDIIRKSDFADSSGNRLMTYAGAIQLSLCGFLVSGFFLPVAYRWYAIYLLGMASALTHIVMQSYDNDKQPILDLR